MYCTYILKSKNHAVTYVGMTNDLQRRINEHNQGKSMFTRRYAPWKVIYVERFETKEQAISREKFYKSKLGRVQIKTMLFE